MYRYDGKNRRPFSAICHNVFGRKVIKTKAKTIDESNIVSELREALSIHRQNAEEIAYLDRYYRGDQPILYRVKVNRPEVNNKVVANLAYYVVENYAAEIAGEPIQYVLRGTDEAKSGEIAYLNAIMESESKSMYDIELCRWQAICGTAFRFIGNDEGNGSILDETPFELNVEDPTNTFVAYFQNNKPAYSCQIREDEKGRTFYHVYTNSMWYDIVGDVIVDYGINGNRAVPVIEYPINSRRLSLIELTWEITDSINTLCSDRINGIEQFVASFVKFVNCEIDVDTYRKMRQEGALVVKSNNGENKADVDVLTSELNQTQGQVAMDDMFEKFLIIQGIANRQSNTGGDTQGAVELRNGHYDAEKRAELFEPMFKHSERMMLRIVLNRLRVMENLTLKISDVEIHISRSKMDNMQVKVQCLDMLLKMGIKPERSIKTVGLFSDPEQVAIESRERLKLLYPEDGELNGAETV